MPKRKMRWARFGSVGKARKVRRSEDRESSDRFDPVQYLYIGAAFFSREQSKGKQGREKEGKEKKRNDRSRRASGMELCLAVGHHRVPGMHDAVRGLLRVLLDDLVLHAQLADLGVVLRPGLVPVVVDERLALGEEGPHGRRVRAGPFGLVGPAVPGEKAGEHRCQSAEHRGRDTVVARDGGEDRYGRGD
ncbi:hypothetical protein CALCODRAFT_375372 [Calocera cornea HHB12733]|uniref:Uncharacterized protein n=1 Tax=Calocera cornea HHB12733 TaxID=1353952 RepID=A0A165EF97_9BASI|nr:hypothetical protein CALCODRAFT_375372 [Calocera cornea HHB12733]